MQIIERYLKSIGVENRPKNISDIDLLIKKHLQELSFSNIPILLDEEISLDLEAISEKMIEQKKGGYCFEHNKLLYEALKYFGFEVEAPFARVLNNQKIDVPKTHRFTLLKFEGERYIVDAGFSFMSPNSLIKFGDTPTKTIFERDYIVKEISANNFELAMIRGNGLYTLYSFDLEKYNEQDFEMGHFYSSKHKDAPFVNNLVLSKITDTKICSLKNNSYHEISKNSKKEIVIKTENEFAKILRDKFEYEISDRDLRYLFDKFIN
ncbi:MAG: arylamine N-acetyltransferase [Sulfurimonas sp.]|uniref:arylamine N-acetyltransferase family protein n=1 Tax=Sulfurimonas sp. TaxID=2022749 RepID=UPI0025F71CF1|nr:arylamine N-acetyltransferase [Sulfurimonas sp.]MCK9490661.1 arylamine N-acetyltransferase [Sulfurimonas sp.]